MSTKEKPLSKPEPERAAEINLEIGIDYLRKGNLKQAKEKIDRALEQNPRNSKAHITAGMLYDRLGQIDKAESHFARGVQLDPENPEIKNTYGAYLCQQRKFAKGEKLALEAAGNPLYRTPEIAYLPPVACFTTSETMPTSAPTITACRAVGWRSPRPLTSTSATAFHTIAPGTGSCSEPYRLTSPAMRK